MLARARLARSVLYLASVIALGMGIGWTASRLDAAGDRRPPAERELVYLPEARFLRPLSLGYNNALAAVVWFRTISYFGLHYRSDRIYPWLAHMCELVTDLDPRAEHVYRFGGILLPWEANQVDAGIRLLEKGTQAIPESWLIPFWLGFNQYYFKHDYEKALAALKEAAQRPGSIPLVTRFASALAAKKYGPEFTQEFLARMEKEADREELRAVIRDQTLRAQAAVDIARLTQAVDLYRARMGSTPASLEQLVETGILTHIPEDPFGGHYQLAPETGRIRSSTGRRPLTYSARGPAKKRKADQAAPGTEGEG